MVKDHLEEANELFRSGFNCSQAVLAVFSEEYGITAATALRAASPFGRGMGGCGGTCGALTGAMMVIGLKYGTAGRAETENLKHVADKTRRLIEIFEEEHGTVSCNDLTGLDQRNLNGTDLMEKLPHFHSVCPKYLATVITFLEEEL
jgi:C_GCAxxG_C_C family probable redox protein